jgi:hypothetical protein
MRRLEALHQKFFEGQLELRFSLREANGRVYPSFADMLSAADGEGVPRGFLTTRALFERVQRLQRAHKVVPIVGDFAGDKALPGLARAIEASGEKVGTFYVSNVEQYLQEPAMWSKWQRNVAALPKAEGAVFVRAWLDQGRAHPRQRAGHRTASFVASIARFESAQRDRRYSSWWEVAADGILEGPRPAASASPAP